MGVRVVSPAETVLYHVAALRPGDLHIGGLVADPDHGRVEVLADGGRAEEAAQRGWHHEHYEQQVEVVYTAARQV